MRAIQYLGIGDVAAAEVEKPAVAAGHVLLRVTAAGVCQTDIHFRASEEQMIASGTVLGHEIAGVIVECAPDVRGFAVGDQVVVHPVWSCGVCRQCIAGRENACLNTGGRMFPAATPGVSINGGLADFVTVPVSALVPADGLDPAFAAVLADAGLVPYHSINAAKDQLRPGSAAVVIGIGGLGQFAVELLRAVTGATIIALDVKDEALAAVRDRVDHAFRSDDRDVASKVMDAAGGHGADFVLDLVGNNATLKLAGSIVAPYGAIRVPGLSDGVFEFETSQTSTSLPWGVSLTRPYSGTHQDLHELVALARTGRINVNLQRYTFENTLQAFDDLEAGKITGRAVVVMD
ncbi:alcohol dehydrogenase catalytic domain-containing protein [Pseudarthrobacter sulfonivorans]|uniref:alcohol dehydrogenase catalytic domain-containing protein n=1 Tax=Pseudarthrobacter sulfonivorans TaxID=121292 RepID=UPI00277E5F57|nr:alcohol dehydrogenase catalytic domain-containing protein [Pseudarthrobacter sulfonivorans]MDP9998426.1 propanol-preferring alcohol dehydrogenase [Pseudarthrobacter sulfonivorans]